MDLYLYVRATQQWLMTICVHVIVRQYNSKTRCITTVDRGNEAGLRECGDRSEKALLLTYEVCHPSRWFQARHQSRSYSGHTQAPNRSTRR